MLSQLYWHQKYHGSRTIMAYTSQHRVSVHKLYYAQLGCQSLRVVSPEGGVCLNMPPLTDDPDEPTDSLLLSSIHSAPNYKH